MHAIKSVIIEFQVSPKTIIVSASRKPAWLYCFVINNVHPLLFAFNALHLYGTPADVFFHFRLGNSVYLIGRHPIQGRVHYPGHRFFPKQHNQARGRAPVLIMP